MRSFARVIGPTALAALGCLLAGCGQQDRPKTPVTASIGSGDAPESAVPSGEQRTLRTRLDPLHPRVKISTSLGDIVVRLDAERAPMTVKNFLFHAGNGHYEGTIFHQVIRDYVAVGGGYDVNLVEQAAHFAIRNEAYNRLPNKRGTIAMARQAEVIDSSTCQFFFNLADNDQLDHRSRDSAAEFGYCVFGEVVEGLEVLDQMAKVPVADQGDWSSVPVEPIVIRSIVPAP
ncbi:MAG: peptidyl-prolyl cis-trans isomerase [Planctomycetales bacterium]|nr:peptidyl-prolyl cis-trans isomerase [Planctomycetales bacterium]